MILREVPGHAAPAAWRAATAACWAWRSISRCRRWRCWPACWRPSTGCWRWPAGCWAAASPRCSSRRDAVAFFIAVLSPGRARPRPGALSELLAVPWYIVAKIADVPALHRAHGRRSGSGRIGNRRRGRAGRPFAPRRCLSRPACFSARANARSPMTKWRLARPGPGRTGSPLTTRERSKDDSTTGHAPSAERIGDGGIEVVSHV
jgi:hypothetical protein